MNISNLLKKNLLTFSFFCLIFSNIQGQDFVLYLDTITAEPNETVSLGIKVENFEDIISMQFGVRWNPSVLEFVEVSNDGNLPDLSPANFETSTKNDGIFRFAWFDNTAQGVDLINETSIFSIKFKLIGQLTTYSDVKIGSELSTFLEVVQGNNSIPVVIRPGRVNIGTPPSALPAIPTLTQWGSLIFGLLLANLGLIILSVKRNSFT